MPNITLTADKDLLDKARAYAHLRQTTVNQLFRDHLARLTGQLDPQQAADEFAQLARDRSGRSEDGFVFDRRAIHASERGEPRQ